MTGCRDQSGVTTANACLGRRTPAPLRALREEPLARPRSRGSVQSLRRAARRPPPDLAVSPPLARCRTPGRTAGRRPVAACIVAPKQRVPVLTRWGGFCVGGRRAPGRWVPSDVRLQCTPLFVDVAGDAARRSGVPARSRCRESGHWWCAVPTTGGGRACACRYGVHEAVGAQGGRRDRFQTDRCRMDRCQMDRRRVDGCRPDQSRIAETLADADAASALRQLGSRRPDWSPGRPARGQADDGRGPGGLDRQPVGASAVRVRRGDRAADAAATAFPRSGAVRARHLPGRGRRHGLDARAGQRALLPGATAPVRDHVCGRLTSPAAPSRSRGARPLRIFAADFCTVRF